MRMQVLQQINALENRHCTGCKLRDGLSADDKASFCIRKCDIGKEIKKLGDKLLSKNDNRIKLTLAKGKDMTTSDVRYLLEKEVSRNVIARALNIRSEDQKSFFNQILSSPSVDLPVRKRKKITKKKQVSKKRTNRGIDDGMGMSKVEDLMQAGKSAKEIQKETGLTISTVYSYMSTIRNSNSKSIKTKTKNKKGKVDKMAKVEETNEIEALEEENKSLMRRISELRDVNRKAGDETQRLTDEVNELKDENESLEAQLNVLKQDFKTLNDDYTKKSDMLNELADENEELKAALKEFDDLKRHLELLRQELDLKNESLKAYKSERDDVIDLYRKEKQKHELIYRYVTLEKEVM